MARVVKLAYLPFSVLSGLLAGLLARKAFVAVWRRVEGTDQAPSPEQREVPIGVLLAGTALQGAVGAAVRAAVDRGSRDAFHRVTGVWPGVEDGAGDEDGEGSGPS